MADKLSEIKARRDYLAQRERELAEARAEDGDNTSPMGAHTYACCLRRADARYDFDAHAPADIALLLAEVERLRGLLCEARAHLVTEMNLGSELRGILAQYLAENNALRASSCQCEDPIVRAAFDGMLNREEE